MERPRVAALAGRRRDGGVGRDGGWREKRSGRVGARAASGCVAAAPVLDVLDALVRVGDVRVAPGHVAEVVLVGPFLVVAHAVFGNDGAKAVAESAGAEASPGSPRASVDIRPSFPPAHAWILARTFEAHGAALGSSSGTAAHAEVPLHDGVRIALGGGSMPLPPANPPDKSR